MKVAGALTRSAAIAIGISVSMSSLSLAQSGAVTASLQRHRASSNGDTLVLSIPVNITPGWHIGAAKPGVVGVPTELRWRFPAGWRLQNSRWPEPRQVVLGRDTVYQYEGAFTIESRLVRSGSPPPGTIQVTMSYGICREVCIPGRVTLAYDAR